MVRSKKITLLRVIGIFLFGLVSGIQVALYLYDYYDDGIADPLSLFIGIGMIILSIGFILFTFRDPTKNN
ncbi:MAG: hypothetical protein WD053_04100 [Gracilimonas sp.]